MNLIKLRYWHQQLQIRHDNPVGEVERCPKCDLPTVVPDARPYLYEQFHLQSLDPESTETQCSR